MPLNKPRAPGAYPILFHALILKGPGDWRIGLEQATEAAADLELRRFAQFRRDLQARPMHNTAKALHKLKEDGFGVRAKLILTMKGWDVEVRIRRPKAWARQTTSSDLPLLQQLEKSLGKKTSAGG